MTDDLEKRLEIALIKADLKAARKKLAHIEADEHLLRVRRRECEQEIAEAEAKLKGVK